ncbi:MAG TPA: GNAT family N-acetyltransferase [Deinococcus radiodurans]|nr:GNAT family N-acetyltransferase [Deinococcus radiodurans]
MTPFTLRPATDADIPAMAAIQTALNPNHPMTAETFAREMQEARDHPLGLHEAYWVAELGGETLAYASVIQYAGLFHPDRYHAEVQVLERGRGQGLGTALAETLRAHLTERGAREVLAGAREDEPHAVAFLQARGFSELEREFTNVLDLTTWTSQPADLPAGYRLRSLPDFVADLGETPALGAFRRTFNEARADEPRRIPAQPYSLDDIRAYVQHPTFFPDGLWLAVTQAGEVAALTELWRDLADPHALNTGLTGTARAHRRRGLALALKRHSLNLAHAQGIRRVVTHNATANAPMLAINTRLGFQPEPAFIEMVWGGLGEQVRTLAQD